MIGWKWSVLGATMALVSTAATAQQGEVRPDAGSRWAGSEIAIGVLEHGANFHPLGSKLFVDKAPPGYYYVGTEEDGTVDLQVVYRTAPLRFALKPRLAAKLQLNTAGRTSFGSLGAEWRQHVFHGRLYGQIGIGMTVHNGYRYTADPFVPGLSEAEMMRRYDISSRRTAFGSRVLFNPNASIGVRLNPRWAIEATWEHFSHRYWFSDVNPGIDNVGLRLVRTLGR